MRLAISARGHAVASLRPLVCHWRSMCSALMLTSTLCVCEDPWCKCSPVIIHACCKFDVFNVSRNGCGLRTKHVLAAQKSRRLTSGTLSTCAATQTSQATNFYELSAKRAHRAVTYLLPANVVRCRAALRIATFASALPACCDASQVCARKDDGKPRNTHPIKACERLHTQDAI